MTKYKTHTCNEISLEDVGKKVRIAGFVETIRDLGGLVFLDYPRYVWYYTSSNFW